MKYDKRKPKIDNDDIALAMELRVLGQRYEQIASRLDICVLTLTTYLNYARKYGMMWREYYREVGRERRRNK